MHPEVGRRLQCMHCVNLGHTMARCRYTTAQLQGPGSRVATEQEVEALRDLATPFTILAEIKEVAAQHLQFQTVSELNAQETVALSTKQPRTRTETAQRSFIESTPPARDTGRFEPKALNVEPEPKTQWVTVQPRRSRKVANQPTVSQPLLPFC